MEFKVNKIDTDIRKKMQEEIKDDKVHSGKSISVKKDLKDDESREEKTLNKKEHKKRYFTIEGTKYNGLNVDVNVEKTEDIHADNSKGRVLDTIK